MKVPRTTSGKYVVEAVFKALDVLEVFQGSEGLSLNQISQRVGLNRSRTFRLLHTLAERGYVERNEEGTSYRLGIRLFERAANVRRDVKDVARPMMLELRQRFNEMVNLGLLEDGHVLYLEIVQSSRPFRMSATVGCRMPAHHTSMGKAILANNPGSLEPGLLAKESRQRVVKLRKELETVRRCGYAVDNEENEPGVACIGAPVFDANGQAIAAMSVSGPVQRLLANEKKIAEALIAACGDVSAGLGYKGKGRGTVA
ncbi:MAG TPA: IclR family transcriptional regulator [Terriglobales bacterium]|nr:IclR family transcriptional regulator [Terriglobales bacterium]